jgi:uncharacterized protein YjbI with pentapeptide repeats
VASTRAEQQQSRRVVRVLLWIIGILVGLAALGGFVWLWWHWVPVLYEGYNGITQAERLTAVTNTRAALLAGLVGVGALGTLWLNSRAQRFTAESLKLAAENVRLSEANLQQTKRSQEETFRLAERGHLTDRYSKAIECLGSDKLDVRLGGIYALEQLATDSDQDRDRATLVEVLSAFVRVHSDPLYRYKDAFGKVFDTSDLPEFVNPRDVIAEKLLDVEGGCAEDVQAAITILGRLRSLPGAVRADLTSAWLDQFDFTGTNLAGARMSWGRFRFCRFTVANMRGAFCAGANFADARLTKADLIGATLSGAWFCGAKIDDADFTNADLSHADFDNGPGERGNADLRSGVSFKGVDLTGAALFGALLATARDLSQEQIDAANGDESTILPEGLQRPAHWHHSLSGDLPA